MDQQRIGLLISEQRKKKNLTQQQLADLLYVTNKAVCKWEKGRSLPDVSILPQLAAVLDLTTDELLSGRKKTQTSVPPVRSTPYISPGVVQRQTEARLHRYYGGVAVQIAGWLIILGQIIGSLRTGLVHLIGSDELLGSLSAEELTALGVPDWNLVFPGIFVFRLGEQTMWKLRSIWALWLSYPVTVPIFLAAVIMIVWGIRRCLRHSK